jgi:hypothetical protein
LSLLAQSIALPQISPSHSPILPKNQTFCFLPMIGMRTIIAGLMMPEDTRGFLDKPLL